MATKTKDDIRPIPIKSIKRSKCHWKRVHSEEDIKTLADHIASVGLLHAITVRKHKGDLELLAGDKRLRACKKLGYVSILANIREVDDTEGELISIYENCSRDDITPAEWDEKISRAVVLEKKKSGEDVPQGDVIDTVALRAKKPRRAVAAAVRRTSKLIPEAKKALKEGKITKSHVEELEPLDPASQRAMLRNILKEGLTVEEVALKKAQDKDDQAEDKNAAYLNTARRYLTGSVSIGQRFRQWVDRLNEHIEQREVPVENIPQEGQVEELQTIMASLDWALNLLTGGNQA